MTQYKAEFPIGTRVRIRNEQFLRDFARNWEYHHALDDNQFRFAGVQTTVSAVSFYHGGDVLYQLAEVPGVWHEVCLCSHTD